MVKKYIQAIKTDNFLKVLLLVVLFHIVTNFIFQSVNTAPPTWDSAGHLAISYIFTDQIEYFFRGETSITNLLKISGYYPPFVHLLGSLAVTLIGRNYEIPLFLIGTLFFVLAIIYLYRLVHYFTQNAKLAFFTAVIFSFFPQVWEQSRHFHLDVPLCALLLISNYYLSKSKSFTERRESILFFVFFSFLQLTKWYGFVYMLVPLYYEFFVRPDKRHATKALMEKRLTNIVLGSLFILFLALPWYIANISTLLANVKVSSTADAGDPVNVLSYESLYHYVQLMISHQIGIVSFVLMLLGLFHLSRDYKPQFKYVAAAILIPYLVFVLISNKDLRYILPLTPYFAFSIAYLWTKYSGRFLAKLGIFLYFIYLSLIFVFLSFNQYSPYTPGLEWVGRAISGPYGFVWAAEPWSYAYNNKNWLGQDILDKIQSTADQKGISHDHFKVLEIADNRFYSAASFDVYKLQSRYSNMDFVVPYYRFEPFDDDGLEEYLSNISFAIIPDNPGPPGLRNIEVLRQLVEYFKSPANTEYVSLKSYKMPDDNVLTVYQRKNLKEVVDRQRRNQGALFKVGRIMLIDKENYGIDPFTIEFTYEDGRIETKEIVSNSAQVRLPVEGVTSFKIHLDQDKMYVDQLQGWSFIGGEYLKDENFEENFNSAGRTLLYEDYLFEPVPAQSFGSLSSKMTVKLQGESIVVKLNTLWEAAFLAYATTGWHWTSVNLDKDNPEITIPTADLIQLEITSPTMLISDFGSEWGVFACYEGRAVCFYPLDAVLF